MKSFIVTFVTTVFIFSLLTAPCYAGQLDLFKQPCSSVSKWPKIPMPAMQHVVTGVTGIGAAGIAFDGWKNKKQRVKLMVSGVAGGAISALVAHHLLKCDLLPSVTSGVMAGLLLRRVLAKQKDQDGDVDDSKKQEEVIDEENGQDLSGGVGNLTGENIGFVDCSSNSQSQDLNQERFDMSYVFRDKRRLKEINLLNIDGDRKTYICDREDITLDLGFRPCVIKDGKDYKIRVCDLSGNLLCCLEESMLPEPSNEANSNELLLANELYYPECSPLPNFAPKNEVVFADQEAEVGDNVKSSPTQDEKQKINDQPLRYHVINRTGYTINNLSLHARIDNQEIKSINYDNIVKIDTDSDPESTYPVSFPAETLGVSQGYNDATYFSINVDGKVIAIYLACIREKMPAPGSTFVITKEGGWLSSPYKVEVRPPKN